jgi:hypothetical protein
MRQQFPELKEEEGRKDSQKKIMGKGSMKQGKKEER